MALDYTKFNNIYEKLTLAHNPKIAKIRGEFLKKESQFFRQYINNQKVLVAGSGLGHDSIELGRYNKEVLGIELFQNLLESSKQYETKKIKFLRGDIRNIPCLDNTFDCSILNMGSIGNFDNKKEILSELIRVSKKIYFDFYINTDYSLKKRVKMYEEEGWKNVKIIGEEIKSEDGLHSEPTYKKDLKIIAKDLSTKIKFYDMCDIAFMAKIIKNY